MPFAVDANAIHAFQYERISGITGPATSAIEGILAVNCIALDLDELCLQEWIDCAGGAHPYALGDWVNDQLISGGIKLFSLAPNTCRKHLQSLGMPSKDHKWVRLAIGCGGRRIVTEDVDFFDPTKKSAPSFVKEKIKNDRSGRCAKALQSEYQIKVMCLRHVEDELK